MSNLAPNYQPASNFASAATTPALSATSSRESPTSVLKSPDLQPGQLLLGEGEGQAKHQQQQLKEEQPLPECWGHRGVRSPQSFTSPLSLFPISSTYLYTYFAAPYGLD